MEEGRLEMTKNVTYSHQHKTCYNTFYIEKQNKKRRAKKPPTGLAASALVLLQSFLYKASRVILKSKSDHISPLLNTLQHLLVLERERPYSTRAITALLVLALCSALDLISYHFPLSCCSPASLIPLPLILK